MPDAEKDAKAEQPAFDPAKLLSEIEALVKSKSVSKDPAHNGAASKGVSWIWSLIIPVLVLAGVALAAWYFQRGNAELARLRHEKNKEAILLAQILTAKKIAANDEKVAAAQKQLDASKERLRVIYADQTAEEKRYEANLRAIDRISSWAEAGVR